MNLKIDRLILKGAEIAEILYTGRFGFPCRNSKVHVIIDKNPICGAQVIAWTMTVSKGIHKDRVTCQTCKRILERLER